MNINITREEEKKVYFADIPFGAIFLYGGDVWMKIPTLAEEDDDDADLVNAIELDGGEAGYFNSNEIMTIPRVAELNIEY